MWILREQAHLAQVGLARRVTLEAVLISTLLLAHLTVPAKLLKADRLLPIADSLGRHKVVLWHLAILLALRFAIDLGTLTNA